ASRAAESFGTKVARSTVPRAAPAEEVIGHSNEGKSGHLLQHQSPRHRAILEALFVPPSSRPKFPPYPGTPISPRPPRANRLRGTSTCGRFPSARIHAEYHDRQLS